MSNTVSKAAKEVVRDGAILASSSRNPERPRNVVIEAPCDDDTTAGLKKAREQCWNVKVFHATMTVPIRVRVRVRVRIRVNFFMRQ